jgi:hypothetical protein
VQNLYEWDANKTKGIENRPKGINRKALTCFKDLAFYPPRQPLGEQCVLKLTLTFVAEEFVPLYEGKLAAA